MSEGHKMAETGTDERKNDELKKHYDAVEKVIDEVENVIIGKHSAVTLLICAMISGGHALIEDVPGTGKTVLASSIAKACDLDFRRAQFTPDVMASDITGFNIYNRQKEDFEFRKGLVMCNILLADEINRASPKTQSALLEAMEERHVTVDGKTYEIPSPFMVIATQNPTGYVGTYPLPEAQLDRFAIRITMGYPTEDEEIKIVTDRKTVNPIDSVGPVIGAGHLKVINNDVINTEVSPEVSKYIVELIRATRDSKYITLGASPRASLSLMRMSQAYAFTKHRNYVVPEDVAEVFYPVVAHRIVMSQESRLSKQNTYEIITSLTKEVEVPYRTKR